MIEMNEVHKWFGDLHVLNDVNLKVNRGEKIVICGPSGSGKELIARWIHKHSNRGSFPFIIASCATLSPERVEQVLFGWNDINSENVLQLKNV